MFKTSSFENELYHSMESNLIGSQIEKHHGFDKLAKAADYLNAAAELFEKAGMDDEANEITEILQQIANKFSS